MSTSISLAARRSFFSRTLPRSGAVKKTGSIADVFASLSGGGTEALPQRFSDLKKQLWRDGMEDRWREVLADLETETQNIKRIGSEAVPRLPFEQIKRKDVDPKLIECIKSVGTVIVEGVQTEEEALRWKKDVLEYAETNKERVTGYPSDNIQVFEFYNTLAQRQCQTHPNTIAVHQFMLSNFLYASDPNSKVSLTPIVYGDRLRIRQPGDESFKLGPHIDGGSLERWEDPAFRSCFEKLLNGKDNWRSHDGFDISPRIDAVTDLYKTGNGQCSVLRPWQGWASLSHTAPTEGSLKVFPNLRLSNAYVLLRPFFSPKSTLVDRKTFLAAENWKVDLESTNFPGSVPGNGQELNDTTHPHLRLDDCMLPIPKVKPGDHVFWTSDTIHAVEPVHQGETDSSVMYIGVVPLTLQNATYLHSQRGQFSHALPPPDFPQGQGESLNVGVATDESITDLVGRRMLGLERWDEGEVEGEGPGGREVRRQANRILFG